MSPSFDKDTVILYWSGEADEPGERAVELWLKQESRCQVFLDTLSLFEDTIQAFPELTPDRDLVGAVVKAGPSKRPALAFPVKRMLAVAASLLLLLGVSFLFLNRPPRNLPTSRDVSTALALIDERVEEREKPAAIWSSLERDSSEVITRVRATSFAQRRAYRPASSWSQRPEPGFDLPKRLAEVRGRAADVRARIERLDVPSGSSKDETKRRTT